MAASPRAVPSHLAPGPGVTRAGGQWPGGGATNSGLSQGVGLGQAGECFTISRNCLAYRGQGLWEQQGLRRHNISKYRK